MMLVITAFLCFLLTASETPVPERENLQNTFSEKSTLRKRETDAPDPGFVNKFVDKVIANLKANTDVPLDPYLLPELGIGFNRTIIFVPVSGEVKLHKGAVTGLSTLHRTGDCTLNFNGSILHVKVKLGMGPLKAKATGTVKFQGLGPSVDYVAEIEFADIDMALAVNFTTLKPNVTKFKLNTLKGLKATISGLGPLSFLIKFLSGVVTSLFKNTFKFITEIVMETVIKKLLENMKISF